MKTLRRSLLFGIWFLFFSTLTFLFGAFFNSTYDHTQWTVDSRTNSIWGWVLSMALSAGLGVFTNETR